MENAEHISYPDHGNAACAQVEDHSFWFKHRNECISTLVGKFPGVSSFVDVGGGNGFVAKRLQDDGLSVAMVEPGHQGAAMGQARGVRRVFCGTLDSVAGDVSPADAVGAFDVVEHIEHDERFVGEVADVLRPGGYFFSTVPSHQWLWSSADDEAGHFRRYTVDSYTALLARRFEVKFISYFFGPLIPPIAILRSLPYRLGRKSQTTDASASREHGTDNGLSARVLSRLLRPEVGRIASLKPISFGSSLIVAAQKRP